ncbi:MAG TPA: hypothetical protein PL151_05700 [Phycisphaerae bacterium]|nr:hypothetical protein [Phycisphaerae bacterium]HOM50007.1 hypothetical protein [Phycisphaerae bacterium]HPP26435.1 hypothetical protein [Phycisphaerae bacterium]HPU26305.1 hypothetical protein [Phycisphaerae bacterium]HQE27233.1 hypothetical protein [Phycisphaerae bacterium]
MTGESDRLGRGNMLTTLAIALMVATGLVLSPLTGSAVLAQDAASTEAPPPAAEAQPEAPANQPGLEMELRSLLEKPGGLTTADLQQFVSLLQRDLTSVSAATQVKAFMTLAGLHERQAQALRADRLDPAAEGKAQAQLDAAVAAYVRAAQAAVESTTPDYVTADYAYGRALSFRPNLPAALLGSARLYAATGSKPMLAVERFQQYIQAIKPSRPDPEIHIEIGKVYASANLWNQALKSFNEARASGSMSDEIDASLAGCYMALNRPKDALEHAKRALIRNPNQPAHYRLNAQLQLGAGETSKACETAAEGIGVARRLLTDHAEDARVLSALSECYAVYVQALDAVLRKDPSDLKARLAMTQAMRGQLEVSRLLAAQRALAILRSASPEHLQDPQLQAEQRKLETMSREAMGALTAESQSADTVAGAAAK